VTIGARVLGAVEVDGTEPPGTKAKALLALLLLQANRTVPTDLVLDALWDQEPPRSAVANIRTYAHGLRRALAGVPARLSRQAGGYRLVIAPECCDHFSFGELAAEGRAALADEQPAVAADMLHRALRLWRGENAADGVPRYGPLAGLDHLDAERMRVVENLAEAQLQLGAARAAIRELTALLAVAPLRGKAWQLRILAHHRLGENDAMVATYAEAVKRFRDDLGVDPEPELTRLYRDLLRLGASGAVPARGPAIFLPAAPAHLIGRERQVSAVAAVPRPAHPGSRPRVVIVEGPPGVGVSAVTVDAANRIAGDFPDGRLYLSLDDAPADPVPRVLAMLGADAPAEPAVAVALLRGLAADRRLLVVLDGVTCGAQVEPLTALGGRGFLLVGARHPLGTVEADRRVHLSPLTTEQSVALLGRWLGADRADAADLRTLAELCEGLPVALRIVAAHLIDRPGRPVRQLRARLADDDRALDELHTAELSLRTGIRAAVRGLTPETRAALPALASAGVFGTTAAARLLGRPAAATESILDELARAYLVTVVGFGRYRMPRFVRLAAN
jgi:DNA-binding SARP family transcriptional activator